MKATPELLLASLIESELVLNPYSGIETQLEKKATYMQSRVVCAYFYAYLQILYCYFSLTIVILLEG